MKKYPKDCVNSNCKNVVYVEKHELHLCLQCETCINNRKIKDGKKKKFKLPKEFAEKWIVALRSGEYKQGDSAMIMFRDLDEVEDPEGIEESLEYCKFCCLGVAAVVAGVPMGELHMPYPGDYFEELPKELQGEEDNILILTLSALNDGNVEGDNPLFEELRAEILKSGNKHLDFNQIADYIENNVEFY